jgi:hypothetical protein
MKSIAKTVTPTAKSGHQDPTNPADSETVRLDELLAVSIGRLAKITDLGKTYLYSEIAAGRLRLTKKGRRSLIVLEDAKAWLRDEPAKPATSASVQGGR